MSTHRSTRKHRNPSSVIVVKQKKKSFIHRMMRRFPPHSKGEQRRWFTTEFKGNFGTTGTIAVLFRVNDIFNPQSGTSANATGYAAYGALFNQNCVWAVGYKLEITSMDSAFYDAGIGFNTNSPTTSPSFSTFGNRLYRTKLISSAAGQPRASFSGQLLIEDIIGNNSVYTADNFVGNFGGLSPNDPVFGFPFVSILPSSPAATIGPDFKLTLSQYTRMYGPTILT